MKKEEISLAQQIAQMIPQLTHLELYTLRDMMLVQEIKLETETKNILSAK